MRKFILTLLFLFLLTLGARPQSNLLTTSSNPEGTSAWKASGDATIEVAERGPYFVVKNRGDFHQVVRLDKGMSGKYALLIGQGSSERINSDGSITGLPYLYGYFLTKSSPNGGVINAYLQGQSMLGRPQSTDDWTLMYGIFEIPADTIAVQFMLNQAERKDDPQNGSAAKFRDVGLFIFDTKKEAEKFAGGYLK